jgi:UDP-N-acetylmuramoylalanine--D-glutamate ligase
MMKKVVIIGGGESGVGAAILAQKLGFEVLVSDFGAIAESFKNELINYNIPFEEKGHSFEKIASFDIAVKSPGVPDHAPVLHLLKENGIQIISEIEFGYLHYSGKILAVTGSNGKTTTSGLLFHVLKSAGKNVALGGNYGKSFARIIAEDAPEMMVLEISSFQLDDIDTFKPYVSILLNITPDHLDRYDYKMANYVNSKFRITLNQSSDDYFIYNGDDAEIGEKMVSFSGAPRQIVVSKDNYINGIVSKETGQNFEISIKGSHNLFNAACVVETCRLLQLNEEEIAQGLSTFVNLPHRLESCGVINGVEFINDSKATNVDSVYYALDAMTMPVIWIAGGTDKGNDYSVLFPLVKNRVKALICLGLDNEKLKMSFKPHIPAIYETTKVSEAVETGLKLGAPGDVVLLSPACASFDLFKNYMDRGDQFKKCVEMLMV